MNTSGYWDQSSNNNTSFSQHEVRSQRELSQEEIRESLLLSSSITDLSFHHHHHHNHPHNHNHLIHAIDEESSNYSGSQNHVGNNLFGVGDDEEDEEEDDDDAYIEGDVRMRHSGISLDEVVYEENENDADNIIEDQSNQSANPSYNSNNNNNNNAEQTQPSLEQIQRVYYSKGLQELEELQLFDLSPLATWKLSSWKQGFGLKQLRDDSPDLYWQSDGSNTGNSGNDDNNSNQLQNPNNSMLLNQLSNPHSITIQFSKKVALERISIFTNYSLDESYTPSRIKIMAGSSEGWDLIEVCTVNFDQPVGWSHIIFNGIRADGVLKCFLIKIIILANHQEGKDSHIRAIRCFGKKSSTSNQIRYANVADDNDYNIHDSNDSLHHSEMLRDLSLATTGTSAAGMSNLSGFLLNNRIILGLSNKEEEELQHEDQGLIDRNLEEGNTSNDINSEESSKIIKNVTNVIGFNTGFQSLELKSISSIR